MRVLCSYISCAPQRWNPRIIVNILKLQDHISPPHSHKMFRSALRHQRFPLVFGAAIGSAVALTLLRSMSSSPQAEAPGALHTDHFMPLPLRSAKFLSKDTKELVFDLPEDHTIGGKTAFMVLFKHTTDDGKDIIRPYTPISTPQTVGSATFVIKSYPNGKMTQYLHHLKDGDQIEVKGPIQKYDLQPNMHKKIGLLGGGTGITPLFQILQEIASNPKDTTKVDLFYGNNTPEDVLIKDEIDALVAKKPGQFKVTYFATKAGDDWKGETGFITKEFLEKNLFKADEDNVKVFVCGPPPLYQALSGNKKSPSDQGELTGALKDLGFKKEQVFKF